MSDPSAAADEPVSDPSADADEPSALLQRLLDRVPAMLAYWGADRRNVAANAAYREWFGLEPAAIHGMHARDLLGHERYETIRPFIDGVLAGHEQHFDGTLTDAQGRMRRYEATYVPDVVDGRTVGFFFLGVDVTTRVEHEQAAARAAWELRALARSLPDAFVMLFDEDLRYRVADGQGLAAYDLDRARVEGRTLHEVLPHHVAELEPRYRAALAGHAARWKRKVRGRVFALRSSPVIGDHGEVIAGMVVGVDVTAEHRAAASRAAVHTLALAAARRAPLHEVAELVVSSAQSLLHADLASVTRFAADEICIVALQPSPAVAVERVLNDGTSAASVVAITGRSCVVERPAITAPGGPFAGMPVAVSIGAPILLGGHPWGAIVVGTTTDFEDRSETLRLLEEFADLVALAIGTSQAFDELDRKAKVDSLTGLPNRRAFDDRLAEELARAARTGGSVGLVIIDLDRFKEINDQRGHLTGDTVLATVAARLASVTRSNELVARLGGDEFVVLISEISEPGDLAAAAERFQRVVGAAAPLDGVTVTASVGAATAEGGTDPTDVLRRADLALYEAKAAGRDRAVVDEPTTIRSVPDPPTWRDDRSRGAHPSAPTATR